MNSLMLVTPLQKYGTQSPLSPGAQATLEKHLPGVKKILHTATSKIQRRDVSCITELSSEHLPEVEIFSLLEEQIPKYKIRSDSLTQFGGYENQDWFIPCPALPISPDGLGLNKDQIRETLNYFLLCGNRVSQMTKAYDDIEAVTRLLEEKEKDLELTVQIGKELLTQNNRLENRVNDLELNIKKISDDFSQLSHELNQRNNYIAILTNDVDYLNEVETPTTIKTINLDLLQKKISSLQDENKSLRHDTLKLVKETDECEEKEKKLMEDFTYQLHSTNSQFDGLSLELERQKEENNLLQEQMYNLTLRLSDTEMKFHDLNTENEEQSSILLITKENQNLLAGELTEFKIRYQEVLSLLNETQEQLRNARKRSQPNIRNSLLGLPIPQADSLQTELMETSMFSENSVDSGIVLDRLGQCTPGFKKVFETVRCVSKTNTFADNSSNMLHLGAMSYSSSSQPKMSTYIQPESSAGYRSSSVAYTNSLCTSSIESSMDAKMYSRDSVISDLDSNYPGQAPSGCPGAPGAKDLEAALNRLTPAEVIARRAMLSHAPVGTYNYDEGGTGFRTPDSIMSVGSYSMSTSGLSQHQWRLPEKLQIVKPLEGSQTLRHWSRLATPTLSGLLDERPGVTIRGGKGLDDLGLHLYTLSDCEEDVDDNPGKRFQSSTCVYTYTNSTVMHPDDGTSVISSMPSSQVASRMPSNNVSRHNSAPMTPRASLSRRNSCSTFSVSLGLASMLNERGIKAVTPSALNTPHGINYTPTVTPCNSPEGGSSSPLRMLSPEPQFLSSLLSSGADLLRRKLIGEYKIRPGNKIMLTRLEKRALRSIKILEKVENMGLESIGSGSTASSSSSSGSATSSSICPLTLQGTSGLYSGRSSSPMAQLTSFKKFTTNDNDEVRIDRETIKAVLSKGLSTESLRSLTDSDSTSSHILDNSNKQITSMSSSTQPDHPIINTRMKQMQRQKSRRHLKNGIGGQRPDLGTVVLNTSNVMKNKLLEQQQLLQQQQQQQKEDSQPSIGFIGTISSLLFGRKGGLL